MSAAFVRTPRGGTSLSFAPQPPSSASSNGSPTLVDKDKRQLEGNEAVIRLELQRRAIRERMQVNDNMIREIDEHLVYVVQFKKEWLHHMRLMESERRTLNSEESTTRKRIEESARVKWDGIMYSFLQPLRREIRSNSTNNSGPSPPRGQQYSGSSDADQ